MTNPKESKASILGELESIKSLLSEDEMAAIPVLEDAIVDTGYAEQADAADANLEQDLLSETNLEQTMDGIPVLDTTQIFGSEPEDIGEIASRETPSSFTEERDSPSLFGPGSSSDKRMASASLFGPGSQEQLLIDEDAPSVPQTADTALTAEELDRELKDLDQELSELDDIDREDVNQEHLDQPGLSNLDFLDSPDNVEDGPRPTLSEKTAAPEETEFTEEPYVSHQIDSEANPVCVKEENLAPRTICVEDLEIDTDQGQFEVDLAEANFDLPEPILAPDALPGQRSLFDIPKQTAAVEPPPEATPTAQEEGTATIEHPSFLDAEAADTEIESAPSGLEPLQEYATSEAPTQTSGSDSVSSDSAPDSADSGSDDDTNSYSDFTSTSDSTSTSESTGNHGPESTAREADRSEETEPEKSAHPLGKGENPFLPKHIRERLHTDRSLIDVIKDDPSAMPERTQHTARMHTSSEAPADDNLKLHDDAGHTLELDQLDDIIHEVLNEKMPSIEEAIRRKIIERLNQPPHSGSTH